MENKALMFKHDDIKITLGGKEYKLVFDLNAFCEIEKRYGSVDKVLSMVLGGAAQMDTTVKCKGYEVDPKEVTIGDATLDTLLPKLTDTQPTAKLTDTLVLLYIALMHDTAVYNANDEICKYSISEARLGSLVDMSMLREINGKVVAALMRDLVPSKADDGKNAEAPEAAE